ncbi:MAG: magnesium transporter [Pseudodesulfovibrio sp.]|uniref:Magnesium transporter MgtE n=1 Tax=Pseudodesulfovibrio aespoeensis (strain ATCC 700646 / DSM 10631 / Aspo-2) TaxID=643562 RepID=E6VYG5_PSEA9|nr:MULTISPECIES: magnesium transporter [Pseudodesulfovibrio]MBU4377742.1 magnesium transporter [Pseudomonadota bacterium]ADU62728.1 magnesium transporter [Pseudodesulfovibrio aespoeensis Aspo-2]MBU4474221.1 magnesium transporter [Pseudomonadota bacterium]MBU4515665.1 magnesium transporter [Pseudomonadota bacterium]MBU4523392.1 magnesium transporter [Pseudomonadota bacterium]
MSNEEEIRIREDELSAGVPADIEVQHPADAAETIEGLDIAEQVKFIKQLPIRDAADSIAEMEGRDQIELFKNLNRGLGARIVEQMSPDDATDLLEGLDEELRHALLNRVAAEERAELKTLLTFDPDTAGGVMNTEVVILDQDLNVDQAIAKIREEVEDKEIPYYAYLTDKKDRLVGVVSLRDILLAKRGAVLKELVKTQSLITAGYNMDKEEVAHLIARYNLLAVPVVDFGNRLLGVVTVDDVIDIIHEEASEDMQAMVGAGADETTDSPWLYSVRMRLPWLIINVLFSSVSAWVVHLYEGNIAEMAVLAVLMPLVANQAGNTGQQALAVMIRQMAMERFDRKRAWLAVLRELRIGLVNGVIISVLVFGVAFAITGKIPLASVLAVALGVDMLLGAFAGAAIPLLLKELGRDPAQASSIFLTTITDSMGFFFLLGLAGLILLV